MSDGPETPAIDQTVTPEEEADMPINIQVKDNGEIAPDEEANTPETSVVPAASAESTTKEETDGWTETRNKAHERANAEVPWRDLAKNARQMGQENLATTLEQKADFAAKEVKALQERRQAAIEQALKDATDRIAEGDTDVLLFARPIKSEHFEAEITAVLNLLGVEEAEDITPAIDNDSLHAEGALYDSILGKKSVYIRALDKGIAEISLKHNPTKK